jgi:hypothetical protein
MGRRDGGSTGNGKVTTLGTGSDGQQGSVGHWMPPSS